MTRNTEADLHTLLDSLKDGEHVKATWVDDNHKITFEGPVRINGRETSCRLHIRWEDGIINPCLTSLEVTRDEEVAVTRDDEEALHALLDSLEDGETVTAEWCDVKGPTTLTGSAMPNGDFVGVRSLLTFPLRWGDGVLHPALHSVTVRRTVVQRWEREGDE